VYLGGAGATQAEVDWAPPPEPTHLLMTGGAVEGLGARIIGRLTTGERPAPGDVSTDIEKLISLLAASLSKKHNELAETLRGYYMEELRSGILRTRLEEEQGLAEGLLELHKEDSMQAVEQLSGIITTNHDGLLQWAMDRVHGGVDIGIDFVSDDLRKSAGSAPLLLQLHGSFTWSFGAPLRIHQLSRGSVDQSRTVWIPPTTAKESKVFPFNLLAGRAYDLLARHCDVLRVVGSSLSQNDWNLLSILYHAQRHRAEATGRTFAIQLIVGRQACERILESCSFLDNLVPIGFLTEGSFDVFKEPPPEATSNEPQNPLAYWLTEKIDHHSRAAHLGKSGLPPHLSRLAGVSP
jgi:hypothetical protein